MLQEVKSLCTNEIYEPGKKCAPKKQKKTGLIVVLSEESI